MEYEMVSELLQPLTKEQEDAVLTEIGYTREQLKADLKEIREWLNNQQHLPPSRLKENDTFLEHYLVGCEGNLDKAKKKLDCYYTIRAYSEIHNDRDPKGTLISGMKEISEVAVMPEANQDGTHLCFLTFNDKDPDKYSFLAYIRNFFNRMEIFMRKADYGSKLYIMFDCKGISPAGMVQVMNPPLIKDLVISLTEALPTRYVKIIGVNVPEYLEVVANNFIRPFLSKKLQDLYILTSSGPEDLLNYFSPSMLPRNYCGLSTNPSLKEHSDRWEKAEEANRQWYLNELSEHVDESKRTALEFKTENPYFGMYISLKDIVID